MPIITEHSVASLVSKVEEWCPRASCQDLTCTPWRKRLFELPIATLRHSIPFLDCPESEHVPRGNQFLVNRDHRLSSSASMPAIETARVHGLGFSA